MSAQILIQRVHPLAIMPRFAHPGDAGMDVSAVASLLIPPGEYRLVGTGLKMQLPEDMEAQVRPRSGLALKYGITVLNSPGTIDSGYRGEVGVVLINHGREAFQVEPGMRIAQLVFSRLLEVAVTETDALAQSLRGEGGYGSSGK